MEFFPAKRRRRVRPLNSSPDEVASTLRPQKTRKQASQVASQLPTPTASGSVDNSLAGAPQSTQSGQFGCWAFSDNVEVFLSLDFVFRLFCMFLYFRCFFFFSFFGGREGGCCLL